MVMAIVVRFMLSSRREIIQTEQRHDRHSGPLTLLVCKSPSLLQMQPARQRYCLSRQRTSALFKSGQFGLPVNGMATAAVLPQAETPRRFGITGVPACHTPLMLPWVYARNCLLS
jgi:hypothetical protein